MLWSNPMSTAWYKAKLDPKRRSRLIWGVSFGVGGLLYLKVWLPITKIGIPCVFHEITGMYCPGCGATRAATALLNMDFPQAFHYNALLFCLLPMYAVYYASEKKQLRSLSKVMMIVMTTLTLAFGVLRNFPEFAWLAPTVIRI